MPVHGLPALVSLCSMSPHSSHREGNTDIPLDVIELIMEELAKDDDMEALKSCSLACRSFRSICQQHIFASIKFDFSKPPFENPLASRFRRLADRKPSIARYVRILQYIEVVDSKREAAVLRRFSHVKFFTLAFDVEDPSPLNPDPPPQDWNRTTVSLQTSFCSFIQANNITRLYLCNIENFPKSLLLYIPALSILSIYRVTVADSPPPFTFIGKQMPPRVSILNAQLGEDLPTVRDLLGSGFAESSSMVDIRHLKQFIARTDDQPAAMEIIGQILKATESIEKLMLSGNYPELNCVGNIASALSPSSLQTLKMIGLSPLLESSDADPYLNLTKELEEISGRNVLEELVFDIAIDTDRDYTPDPGQWAQLDVALSMADGFPLLRHVRVTTTLYCYCHLGHQEIVRKMWDIGRNGFPRLVAAEQVEFIFNAQVELL